jgi:hypothetical protein
MVLLNEVIKNLLLKLNGITKDITDVDAQFKEHMDKIIKAEKNDKLL